MANIVVEGDRLLCGSGWNGSYLLKLFEVGCRAAFAREVGRAPVETELVERRFWLTKRTRHLTGIYAIAVTPKRRPSCGEKLPN